MLRTDLVELINSGEAWAFVGSGASIGSGGLTWSQLLDSLRERMPETARATVDADDGYARSRKERNFPRCFSVVESVIGRETLEAGVKEVLSGLARPGRLAQLLADWPFRGFITTNYDHVIEATLSDLKQRGWVSVGNSDEEVRKVASSASEVVWHVHGSLELPGSASRLILTESDYDLLYLQDTPVSQQLSALLSQHRVVFFGFGFQDEEVKRVLRRVGQLTNPARPLYAVLPDLGGYENSSTLRDLRDRYNIEVVPYTIVEGSHERLMELLDVYKSFTLRRSMRLTGHLPAVPSFDPETTGLLVYNQLCLAAEARLPDQTLRTLLRARVLSQLRFKESEPRSFLLADITTRTRTLRGSRNASETESSLEQVLGELRRDGFVDSLVTGDDPVYFLTDAGRALVDGHAATSARLGDQFSSSLLARARELTSDEASADRVAEAGRAFLLESLDKRALGVAKSVDAPSEGAKSYHLVGLLQALPTFMEGLPSESEALALSNLVQGVLARPSDAERKFIAVALQARFGVHLLGADPSALAARTRELTTTVFLLDSTTAIPFLARSSVGYEGARLLVKALRDAGATVATTSLLGKETAEHARWALTNVGQGLISVDGLRAASGRAGGRANAFVDGLLEEVSRGVSQPDLVSYISETCGCSPRAKDCRDKDVQAELTQEGVPCVDFAQFTGFEQSMLVRREEVGSTIARLREERGSYRHERQVMAEAEALLLIEGFREGTLGIDGERFTNGFFVSHTRVIDTAAGGVMPITIRPEPVLQWLTTLMPPSPAELDALVSLLLYELIEFGVEIVDRERLQTTFATLLSASREHLDDEMDRNRVLVASLYGENGVRAFREARDEDVPLVLEGWYAQQAKSLTQEVEQLSARVQEAESKGKLSQAERAEYERLKRERGERKKRDQRRKRAAQSNPGRRARKRRNP